MDTRVEDYLNDKLQTHADLDNLDTLLENVKNQQDLLKKQLLEAESTFQNASKSSQTHKAHVQERAQEFQRKQADIDRRLLILTHSDTSDDAVQKFDSHMEKLRRLDTAKGYMDLLMEVERLRGEARQNFNSSPQAALKPYTQLQSLAIRLKQAQPAAEDAAPHLVDHVEQAAKSLWNQIKNAFGSEFETTLAKIKWPGKDLSLDDGLEDDFTTGVERLLQLQEPELNARESNSSRHNEPLVLLPLEVMAKPLELRFRYHFYGDRPTNRLDKPEFFLSHIIDLLNTYDEFFGVYLQPILLQHFKGSNLSMNPIYIESTSAMITAFLPMVLNKVFSLLPQISNQPQLLSHLIHELMSFDAKLRDDWDYEGGTGVEGWKGLTNDVLVKKDWFGKWLQVEKNFALARYKDIIDESESGEIDYDSVDQGVTKPTKAAVRVNDLLETITDRYRPLTSFSQKKLFLIDIQIEIFDQYHDRLKGSLEAYRTLTSSVARTVQGISKEELSKIKGTGGLDRLCRVYGSSEYIEKKLRDWSDDIFFLELWDDLQFRAKRKTGSFEDSSRPLTGDSQFGDTTSHLDDAASKGDDSGSLFDETSGAFHRLRVQAEELIWQAVETDFYESIRPYSRINPWASLSSESNNTTLTLTAELDGIVQQLSSYMGFLAKVLAAAPLRRITRQILLSLQNYFFDHILMRNNFSAQGASQFQRDMNAVSETVDLHVGAGQGRLGMKRLQEAIALLNMPITDNENGANEEEEQASESQESKLDLKEVESRVFASNESAREVLEELAYDHLTESEARNILGRRIELSS